MLLWQIALTNVSHLDFHFSKQKIDDRLEKEKGKKKK